MAFYAEETHTECCITYITNLRLVKHLCMVPFWSWFLTEHTRKTTGKHLTLTLYVFVKIATSINNISE